jgi:transposase InsO family protein
MPWSVRAVSEIRLAFVHEVVSLQRPLTEACRKYGISRKTGYKGLARYRADPAAALNDRSRRPTRCPRQTAADLGQRVLAVRDQYGWGAGKSRDYLRNQAADDPRAGAALPCERTVGNILRRHGRIADGPPEPPAPPPFFARSRPHALWQCDFKGPVEVARRKLHPFTVLDDHSRFLLALRPCPDVTRASAWAVLWDTFGEFGLPEELLCDNACGTQYPGLPTLSWFEARLIRLGIRPAHGRPYHPQTQGKVERLHGTLEAEVWPHAARSSAAAFDRDVQRWRVEVYNAVRPHEALGGQPPLRHYRPGARARPAALPEVSYPAGGVTRRVDKGGDVSWRGYRILVGAGLTGEVVRVEERAQEVAVFYGWKQVRCLSTAQLVKGKYL